MRITPTYANVASTLALVLALGGTGAYAAGLAKDSVGSKQIKNGAVKAVDVKKDAITGAQVKESTLGKVPSAAKVDGITQIEITKPENPPSETTILTRGPLRVTFFCDFAPTSATLRLYTTADDSAWSSDSDFDNEDVDFDTGGPVGVDTAFGNSDGAEHVDFSARAADGTSFSVTGLLLARNGTCTADLTVIG